MSTPCPNCGNRQNPPGTTTCRVCGQPLSANTPVPVNPNPRPGGGPLNANPVLVDPGGHRYSINVNIDTYIGSRGCAIMINGAQVLPRHARLFVAAGCLVIEPAAGAQVLVNNNPISAATPLQPRDLITIGSTVLAYIPGSNPLPQGQPAPAPQPVPQPIVPVRPAPVPAVVQPPVVRPSQGDLEGDVTYIDGPYMEEPDMTAGRVFGQIFGFILALWKPAFLLLGNRQKQVPVRYVRVEDAAGQIRAVKMKGEVVTGMIGTGDHVVFWGRWEGGTLIMQKGFNQTANTAIGLRQ